MKFNVIMKNEGGKSYTIDQLPIEVLWCEDKSMIRDQSSLQEESHRREKLDFIH